MTAASGIITPSGSEGLRGFLEAMTCVVVAVVILRLETQRRNGDGGGRGGANYMESCKRMFRQCGPEAAGVFFVVMLAAAFRARGDRTEPVDAQAWESIKSQWPILMTADTLLSLQAMLRLVVYLSVVLRGGSDGSTPTPLADEAVVFSLGAGIARVALQACTSFYLLDGPLGGMLPAACEVAVLPLLLVLSMPTIRRSPLAVAVLAAIAGCFAFRNNLGLVGQREIDGLFVLAHSLDCLAATAYLLRSLLVDQKSSSSIRSLPVGFVHILMVVQQVMPAYYFLVAFEAAPELVQAGRPFEVLQLSNVVGLGAYLGASVLHFADVMSC